jgi:predicted DNA-binding mobile mystery protein A
MKSTNKRVIALNGLSTASATLTVIRRPVHGWLRAVRNALGLSRESVAKKLKVTQAAVRDYERAEADEAITLATLRKVAGALDCDLVVGLIPRGGHSFIDLAAKHDPEIAHLKATEHSMALEAQASGDVKEQVKARFS